MRTQTMLVALALAGIAVLLGVSVFGIWLFRDAHLARKKDAQFAHIAPGEGVARVIAAAGKPDEHCQGSIEIIWPLEGGAQHSESHRTALESITATTFIYRFNERKLVAPPACKPLYNDMVIGFDQRGQVLWMVRFAGQSAVEYDQSRLVGAAL